MPTCQLPSIELFYQERGQGEPLIFLSGLGGDHLYWMGQLRAFSKHFRCIAIDIRDVGQSTYMADSYEISDIAADLADFMRHLHLPPAHIVGLSMGGMIAQELALQTPGLVKSLVLSNTIARADDWFASTLNAFEAIRKQVPDTATFFETVLPWWVSFRFFADSGRISWLRYLLHQNPHQQKREGFFHQLEAIRKFDTLNRLSAIKCPTLIVAGEDDWLAPCRYSRELHDRIAGSELSVVPGVGHAFPIENPGEFNSCLSKFLLGPESYRRRSA